MLGLAAIVGALALTTVSPPAAAAAPTTGSGRSLKATPLVAGSRVVGAKSASGQLARTDKGLLRLASSRPVNVVVKLDYDSLAGYRGGVKGYAATSPAVTGRKLSTSNTTVRRYAGYVEGVEGGFLRALRSRLPDARAGRHLRTVYGGVAVKVPGNRVAELLRIPGAVAVQKDTPQRLLTDSSPKFIGAPALYGQLGGGATAGKGVIVGVLDTGAWPEHPSYVDRGNLPAPPPKGDGTPRTCKFGDNPLTLASDVFACNHKLISGQPFLDTYNSVFPGTEAYPDTARDSNGHGTHTSTTAAGRQGVQANPLGVSRGKIRGIAPGAHVAVYKVCGAQGCFSSDSAAAVAQAILDGVRVINFSISGGTDPFTDAVELAFLDAYAAGVLVSASAGNEGPGAGTVNHLGPWVTTVAASTQRRAFESTLSLAGGGATETLTGASITGGVATPLPVVLASAPPYSKPLCDAPAPAGAFTGKVVACLRGGGIARVAKGFNVLQGGAAGMVLYNPPGQADVETDNHWLPTVHLDGDAGETFTGFLAAHPGTTASFTAGAKVQGKGDVMADFSSRGPGGDWLKPDVTAPGVQILAGMTPTPESTDLGPPGQLYQAIAGTSMSAPHVAGAAALLFAKHPNWTPGQVKSALDTTALTKVVKEDGATPADPFDFGGGRVNLYKAGDPGLTFDESAADFAAASVDVLGRVDLNLPSVSAAVMPGEITTRRVARNVSGRFLRYKVTTEAPAGTQITVTPSSFGLAAGASVRLRIHISAPKAAPGQYFGRINLDRLGSGGDLHLPVAFFRTQGQVSLAQTCDPTTIARQTGRSTCEVTVQNNSLQDTSVVSRSRLTSNLRLTGVDGAFQASQREVVGSANLAALELASPSIAPGASPRGYLPLAAFGVEPIAVGDEEALNFTTPAFRYADQDYTSLGVTSNGYSVAGGVGSAAEIQFEPQTLPDPARPNSVLAPFWTDLDGSGAPGVLAALLTDGANDWIVIEWRVNVFGTTSQRVFQQWLGVEGAEDISFAYDPVNLPAAPPAGYGLTVGAENQAGSAGDQVDGPPTGDLRVTSAPGSPGGTLKYRYELKGVAVGAGEARTTMRTPLVRGDTTDFDQVLVE